jgi:catechol 2,3-dioxygenase-like lactoylglutathione lyase family enzyme
VAVRLNHTIVAARDKHASAAFMAGILGLPAPAPFGPFMGVKVANDVTLDFIDSEPPIVPQHYAFLVGEPEFDQIFGRVVAQRIPYWADPGRRHPQQINHRDGGRGVYFEDPDGHFLELLTRPYGSGDERTTR